VKGRITLGIYVAIGITGAAFGQHEPLPGQPLYKAPPPPPTYSPIPPVMMKAFAVPPSPPGWKVMGVTPAPLPTPERTPETVVIKFGNGGRVDEHRQRFADYRLTKTKVEIRGPCYSACTLILGYVAVENICIAEGTFMAFHAIRTAENRRLDYDTWQAYNSMPPEIRWWIDDNGGHENLPLNGYWTLYDRQMWAMGYPKCK
jgi:hypothetical protein